MDRSNRHQNMVDSLQDRLRAKGIILSDEEVCEVAEAMRKEILHRHVIIRRRVHNLRRVNRIKDQIVEQIFLKLGKREGIKVKDVFNLIIPVLVDIIKIQRCALFSVMENGEQVVLEAGYPEAEHGIGKIFSVEEPYINAVVNLNVPPGDFKNETIRYNYIFVKDPRRSDLIPHRCDVTHRSKIPSSKWRCSF
jgi:hypothetical protein